METIKVETVNGKTTTYVKYTEEELAELKEHAKKMAEERKKHQKK